MVSSDTLLIYLYWKIPFTVYTDVSDKQLVAVISQNNKPVELFSRRISKSQHNNTTTKR